jgi:hypothetical protein
MFKVTITGSFSYDAIVEADDEDNAVHIADRYMDNDSNNVELSDYDHDVTPWLDPGTPGQFYVKYHLPGTFVKLFRCVANNSAHACRQCEDALPGATIIKSGRIF